MYNSRLLARKWTIIFCLLVQWVIQSTETKPHNECDGSHPIITEVQQGAVQGSSMISYKGKPFCVFRGIPFAEPPTGQLRFQPPHPPKPWKGILKALMDPSDCVQSLLPFLNFKGDEDCLYLNVYTPQLKPQNGKLLDVIIWIFPGQFYFGTMNSKFYQPKFFMDKEVVLVAFNYRLGAFGFLSTGDDEAPGNYGMKDQVAAFRWVQDNIRAFGGNPNSVTIFGESSGSSSVHYHLLSPMTKDLFHRAISMGGMANTPWARNDNPKEIAIKQAKFVGCPTESSSKLVACLRQLSAKDIQNTLYKMFMLWVLPSPEYTPVVEKKTERNPEPFITENPFQIMLKGNFHRVPWLMGHNSQGMGIFLVPLFTAKVFLHYAEQFLEKGLPVLLMLQKSVKRKLIWEVAENITKFYGINRQHFEEDQEMTWLNLATDRFFIHGTHRAAILHSLAGHKPIYKYNFAYRGRFSWTEFSSLKNYGVSHADELMYMFQNHYLPISSNDEEVRQLFLTLWTNFAKYGNPTPPKSFNTSDSSGLLENFVWEPIGEISEDNMHIRYLNIGQVVTSPLPSIYMNQNLGPVKFNMAIDLHKDRMKFWDSLPLRDNVESLHSEKEHSGSRRIQFCMTIFMYVLFTNRINNLLHNNT